MRTLSTSINAPTVPRKNTKQRRITRSTWPAWRRIVKIQMPRPEPRNPPMVSATPICTSTFWRRQWVSTPETEAARICVAPVATATGADSGADSGGERNGCGHGGL